jgi:aminoglycoside 3-N-acetyltransferase
VQQQAADLLQSSISSLGWVCSGSVAVVQALMDALIEPGTLVMPINSGDYSDPPQWQSPPVPESWQVPIRENMPAFDPPTVPSRGVGRIPETFRAWPGALRSSHPAVSFAAWGRHAIFVGGGQSLDYPSGKVRLWPASTSLTGRSCCWRSPTRATPRLERTYEQSTATTGALTKQPSHGFFISSRCCIVQQQCNSL